MAKPFLVICRKFFHVFIVGCYIPVGSLSQSLFIPLIAPYKLYFSNRLSGNQSFHPNPTTYENFRVTRGEDLVRGGRSVFNGAVDQFAKRSDVEIVPVI